MPLFLRARSHLQCDFFPSNSPVSFLYTTALKCLLFHCSCFPKMTIESALAPHVRSKSLAKKSSHNTEPWGSETERLWLNREQLYCTIPPAFSFQFRWRDPLGGKTSRNQHFLRSFAAKKCPWKYPLMKTALRTELESPWNLWKLEKVRKNSDVLDQ